MSRPVLVLAFALVAAVSSLVGVLAGGGGALQAGVGSGTHALASRVDQAPPSFAEIAMRVNPAVVNITVIENGAGEVDEAGHPHGELPGPRRGEGSGFVVDAAGYILTNQHVVASPERIRVRLADKRELPAVLVGADRSTDLALIKVDATNLPTVPLGDSDQLRVGEWVAAIGNPYRFDHSVTVGVVSSKGRKIYDPAFDAYIQTDAAINPGNSGGPLVNAAGEVVGINSAVSVQGQGIGFAVPINVAKDVLSQLKAKGHVTRGYLGIQLQELDPDLQRLVGLTEPRGAMVLDVLAGKAGEAAGLRRYDVITAVGDDRTDDGEQLVRHIAARLPGSRVQLTVMRDGHELKLEAQLEERDPQPATDGDAGLVEPPPEGDTLGLRVTALSRQMQSSLHVPTNRTGVVIDEVVGLSPGADQLAHGDIVVEVNRQPTQDLASYKRVVASLRAGDVAWLFVYRPRPEGAFLAKVEVER